VLIRKQIKGEGFANERPRQIELPPSDASSWNPVFT